MRCSYKMPFGANIEPNGTIHFAVWAPTRDTANVKLLRPEGDVLLPMERADLGWFFLNTAEASAGSRYFFDFGDGHVYPDPASRRQPEGVHGPSEVVDPRRYEWSDGAWRGRSWNEAAIYELHVGTFSSDGNYGGVERQLDYLQRLGVTAIELMPVAQGPGTRSWGYDGVYLYAPEVAFGTPDDLKRLIDMAHRRGLMVFLDVVYNHFGPEGNYIGKVAPDFFTQVHKTPWGDAINFDQGMASQAVRSFYWHNALYWLEEYRFDGLRCDAVHAIVDDSPVHIFEEVAMRVRELARRQDRHIHIVAENEMNVSHLLERDDHGRPRRFTAQWNDDFHHGMHVMLTGETDVYYVDYAEQPYHLLARSLTEGFSYQGEASRFRDGKRRGENSGSVPMSAFINFLQNHDQAGNRPMGERLLMLTGEAPMRAAIAVLLLAPSPPLIFMGEEFGATQPFPYFCDFGPELSQAVREGRIKDFAVGDKFQDPGAIEQIPDPTAQSTFDSAVLDWSVIEDAPHCKWLEYYRNLLTLRASKIAPLVDRLGANNGRALVSGTMMFLRWPVSDGQTLTMIANLGTEAHACPESSDPDAAIIYSTHPAATPAAIRDNLPPWSVTVALSPVQKP